MGIKRSMTSDAQFIPQMHISHRLQSNILHEHKCMHDDIDYLDVICSAVGGESSTLWANETRRHASQSTPENNQISSSAESYSEDHTKPPHPNRT